MKKICDSHLRGMKIKCEDIARKEDDSGVWIVKSQRSNGSGPEQEYTVARTEDVCPASSCALKCLDRNIYIHYYKCTCVDSVVYMNICEHIHAVCLQMKTEDSGNAAPATSSCEFDEMVTFTYH